MALHWNANINLLNNFVRFYCFNKIFWRKKRKTWISFTPISDNLLCTTWSNYGYKNSAIQTTNRSQTQSAVQQIIQRATREIVTYSNLASRVSSSLGWKELCPPLHHSLTLCTQSRPTDRATTYLHHLRCFILPYWYCHLRNARRKGHHHYLTSVA